jgi:hypothetical protein
MTEGDCQMSNAYAAQFKQGGERNKIKRSTRTLHCKIQMFHLIRQLDQQGFPSSNNWARFSFWMDLAVYDPYITFHIQYMLFLMYSALIAAAAAIVCIILSI